LAVLGLMLAPVYAAERAGYYGDGSESPDAWADGTGEVFMAGLIETDGPIIGDVETIAADDTTPDVSGANTFKTSANTGATAITALDNEVVGAYYTIICGSLTNATTIADGGNFSLNGAWVPAAVGDSITLFVTAADSYYEAGRGSTVPGLAETKYFTTNFGDITANATTRFSIGVPSDNITVVELYVWSYAKPADADGTILLNVYKYDVSATAEEALQETADFDCEGLTAITGEAIGIQTTTPANLEVDAGDPMYIKLVNNSAAIDTNFGAAAVTVEYYNR
jgi:hypothetical protein